MMRKPVIAIAMLVLVAAACGDDDTTTTTSTAGTTTTATTTATTTTVAVTTTADAGAERAAAAAELAGTYTGEWKNTTFGSTGPIEATLDVDVAARFAILTLDLGGFVFGGSDPDPLVVEFDLVAAGPYAGSNDLFGDFTVDFDESGHLTITAPAVPGVGGLPMTMEGDLIDGAFTGTYTIEGLAEGTFTATRG